MTTGGVRYARVGEASIAYRVIGSEGPYFLDITSVFPGILAAEHSVTRGYWERISRFARVVVFDVQGSGRSDPLPLGIAASVERQAEQAIAVFTSAGIEHAYVGGHGCCPAPRSGFWPRARQCLRTRPR